jgi:hypothetical protein
MPESAHVGPQRVAASVALARPGVPQLRIVGQVTDHSDRRVSHVTGFGRLRLPPSQRPPAAPDAAVRTFCTSSRRPAGPLAPPTRRPRLRSRSGKPPRRPAGAEHRKIQAARRPDVHVLDCGVSVMAPAPSLSGSPEPVKSAYGAATRPCCARLLAEPARKSLRSQPSGAGHGLESLTRLTNRPNTILLAGSRLVDESGLLGKSGLGFP